MDYVPTLFGLLAVMACWRRDERWLATALCLAFGSAWWAGQATWPALSGGGLVWILAWHARADQKNSTLKTCATIALVIVAVILSEHWWPGFHNLRVFDRTHFTPDAAPFTMYLNLDKTCAGLAIARLVVRVHKREGEFARATLVGWAAVVSVMLPLAWATHYVAFDLKWPTGTAIWAMNNLFFVCLSEESLYRGLIQGELAKRWPHRFGPIFIASLLFGIDHYHGGWPYVALAAVAGLIYGWVYQKTKHLEASMLVHFGLNATHFLCFTYPSL